MPHHVLLAHAPPARPGPPPAPRPAPPAWPAPPRQTASTFPQSRRPPGGRGGGKGRGGGDWREEGSEQGSGCSRVSMPRCSTRAARHAPCLPPCLRAQPRTCRRRSYSPASASLSARSWASSSCGGGVGSQPDKGRCMPGSNGKGEHQGAPSLPPAPAPGAHLQLRQLRGQRRLRALHAALVLCKGRQLPRQLARLLPGGGQLGCSRRVGRSEWGE